jgi:hypothetical protein
MVFSTVGVDAVFRLDGSDLRERARSTRGRSYRIQELTIEE